MELVTRAEELILLAVWRLKENAYCVPLRTQISEITGEEWSLGSIYMPLDRLVKRGLLDSYLTEATPERGGRRKRIYTLTKEGLKKLQEMKSIEARMWKGLPDLGKEI